MKRPLLFFALGLIFIFIFRQIVKMPLWVFAIVCFCYLIYFNYGLYKEEKRNTAKQKKKRNKGFPYKKRRNKFKTIEEDDADLSQPVAYPTLANE